MPMIINAQYVDSLLMIRSKLHTSRLMQRLNLLKKSASITVYFSVLIIMRYMTSTGFALQRNTLLNMTRLSSLELETTTV